MTVPVEDTLVVYNCDGSKTEFDFTFKVFQTSDIKVILTIISTGAETVLTETTHYAITGSLLSGGKVTTVDTYSNSYKLTIKIDIDLDQETDLIYGGSYLSEALEITVDKLTKIVQQLAETLGRTIQFKETSGEKDIEIDNLVALKYLVVNSTGDKIEMGEGGSGSGGGGFESPTELTIVSGEITVSGSDKWRFHSIDTEDDAASDDLVTINGGNPGDIFIGQAADNARTIVCKDGVSLDLQANFSLNNTTDKIMLLCISTGVWHGLSRESSGG